MYLLDQIEHGCSKYWYKCDSWDDFVLEKTSFIIQVTGANRNFAVTVPVPPKHCELNVLQTM